jgi:hypothetical protein
MPAMKITVDAAMRARDVSRPLPAEPAGAAMADAAPSPASEVAPARGAPPGSPGTPDSPGTPGSFRRMGAGSPAASAPFPGSRRRGRRKPRR